MRRSSILFATESLYLQVFCFISLYAFVRFLSQVLILLIYLFRRFATFIFKYINTIIAS